MTSSDTQYTGLLSPLLRDRRVAAAVPHLRGRVLDVGCADGPLADHVTPDRYLGVDLDARAVAAATAAHPGHRFITPDLLGEEAPFDTVVALAVIEHIPEPGPWLRSWAEHLAPDGQIVLTTPHKFWEPLHDLGAKLRLTSPEAADEHEVTFDQAMLSAVLAEAGLRVTVYRRFLLRMNQLVVGAR